MSVEKVFYGTTSRGEDVYKYIITNIQGMSVEVISYGATLDKIYAPDKDGHLDDVLIGFSDIEGHENRSDYQGMTVGRYANRIAKGKFTIDGVTYEVTHNEGEKCLHGGGEFSHAIWKGIIVDDNKVEFSYFSLDGTNGFPGNMSVTVTYTLDNNNALSIEYSAVSDKKTVINLTNHAYFNLGGFSSGSICDHELMIDADFFTPIDADSIPLGGQRDVTGTPFDFRKPKKIGENIHDDYEQLNLTKGYDHNFCLNQKSDSSPNAVAYDEKTGRVMEMYTDLPGVQLYCGNFLDGVEGKEGTLMQQHAGFCLETQVYPDSPNQQNYPKCVYDANEKYTTKTVYKFSVKE